MSRNGSRMGAVVALVLVAGVGWVVWSHGSTSHDLDRFGKGGMSNRFFDFDDGSQLSVGSPDHHRVVVQWKDPDSHRWTAPTTVYENNRYPTYDNTIRQGGSTVAIQQVFTFDSSSEDDEANLQVDIVCNRAQRRCDVQDDPGHWNPPEVTADGRTALVGLAGDPRRAVLWTTEDGFQTETLTAPAGFGVPSVGLVADGSLRGIVETPHDRDCTLNLLAGAPRSGDLKVVGHVTTHSQCGERGTFDYPAGGATDWIPIDDKSWLIRKGSRWTETDKDPSGLIQVPYEPGCRFTVQTQYENRPNLSYSSPDGRRIQVQVRRLRDPNWSKPVLIDAVPADMDESKGAPLKCSRISFAKVGSRGYALALIGGAPGHGRAVAVTRDLKHWESEFSPGARGNLSVDKGNRVIVGKTVVWTPRAGLGE